MVSHFRWKRCESKYYKATCQWVAWCICGRNSQYTHYQRLALCSFIAASALIARNYGWDLEPNNTKSRFLRRMLVRVTLLLQGINTHTHIIYIYDFLFNYKKSFPSECLQFYCSTVFSTFHLNSRSSWKLLLVWQPHKNCLLETYGDSFPTLLINGLISHPSVVCALPAMLTKCEGKTGL